MKFIAPVLFALPAVMGRACKIRHSHSSAAATAVSTAQAAITTAVAVQSSVVAEPETESAVQEEQTTVISVAEPQTTLATAVIVSSSSSTSAAAAASSSAASDDSSSDDSSSTGDLTTEEVSGSSTFYGGNLSGGNCMFTTYTLPSSIYGTAFSGQIWDSAAHCGACIEVTGPSGTITAMIVDQCPECDEGHLDLFPDAFTAVGGTDGIVDTSYKFVKCGITSPLILHNKTGTSAYWFSIQVVNSNVPVAKLEVSTDGGSTWQSTTRQDYNFFEESAGFGVETVDVRVTSTTGETITVSKVGVTPDAEYTAASNF
ncbi:RlpA-like double-psi beta-barrel-protein domain-containing protein-containing protein [Dactylonectria estremocensis]|uniref:RlpA-like double-psi beta-barrel-protein domain-containing protein-containing protein n=1 Tax=Dactylonectria estremocensis TaxID=1079267 RepID=A0A9P9FET9_9HYPO|nr:RlpA-like double-psi beta-barrel-protein domain-containing protein-containing protein [Dactylonectria estremocensis]